MIPIPVGNQPHRRLSAWGIDCAWPCPGWLYMTKYNDAGVPVEWECSSLEGHHRWRRNGELWELIEKVKEVEHGR